MSTGNRHEVDAVEKQDGGGYDTNVARVMQNLRQIVNISPEDPRNLIGSFAIDNYIS